MWGKSDHDFRDSFAEHLKKCLGITALEPSCMVLLKFRVEISKGKSCEKKRKRTIYTQTEL